MSRPVQTTDVLLHRIPFELQLSPDGRTVLWSEQRVTEKGDRTTRCLVRRGPDDTGPVAMTTTEGVDRGARFSPDGKRIAFLRSRPDDEGLTRLCWIPTDGGETREVLSEKADFGGLSWSPDSRRLVLSLRRHDDLPEDLEAPLAIHVDRIPYKVDGQGYLPQDRFHLYVIDLDAVDPSLQALTDGPFNDEAPQWSPKGDRIAFLSNRRPDRQLDPESTDVWVVSADGGEPVQCTPTRGMCFGLSWSPDGAWIAVNRSVGEVGEALYVHGPLLYRIDPTGEAPEVCLTPDLERSVADLTIDDLWGLVWDCGPNVLPDQSVIVPISDSGTTRLWRVRGDGALEPLELDGVLRGYHMANGRLGAVVSSQTAPGRIVVLDLDDGSLRQVAWPLGDWVREVAVQVPQMLWIDHPQGHRIQGWLMLPEGEGPHPLLLQIHGGPVVQFGDCWFHENHVLCARGFAVLYVNPRGSRGYGNDFCEVIRRDWGTLPYDDLMTAVDHVLQLGLPIDPERMGVLGGSYGGYMTNWIIAATDRFKAACTQRTVSDVETMMFCDFGIGIPSELGLEPHEEPAEYRRLSPISRAAQMNTPLLILQGLADHRTPPEQGERLFVTLKRLGKEVEMVLFPGASHGLSRDGRPDQRVKRLEVICAFFERHLQ